MSVLSNQDLATAISNANCGNLETINDDVNTEMTAGEGIFVVSIGRGGSGITSEYETDVYDTLIQISESNAIAVNVLISTGYEIISKNGYPGE